MNLSIVNAVSYSTNIIIRIVRPIELSFAQLVISWISRLYYSWFIRYRLSKAHFKELGGSSNTLKDVAAIHRSSNNRNFFLHYFIIISFILEVWVVKLLQKLITSPSDTLSALVELNINGILMDKLLILILLFIYFPSELNKF